MVDCLILAGGLGTRLRPAVKNVPKPMADINGQPFLHWQLEYLARQGIERVVLSVGYMSEKITSHFGPRYLNMEIEYEEEDTPLGTGGAIINALKTIQTNDFFILNGDTFFPVDFNLMINSYRKNSKPALLMATFPSDKDNRYGALEICSDTHKLLGLKSSRSTIGENANGGVYLCNKKSWLDLVSKVDLDLKLSFEDDLIPLFIKTGFSLMTHKFESMLIDIGTPDDYIKARKILPI